MRRNRWGLDLVLTVLLVGLAPPAAAHYITGSENVSGNRRTDAYTLDGKTYGPFAWDFKYDRSFDGKRLTKDVEIKFAFDTDLGFTDEQRKAYGLNAEREIESIWNGQFIIRDGALGGVVFALAVDVTLGGPFDQTVRVHLKEDPDSGNVYNMTNWYINDKNGDFTDTPESKAHEFGHMLGLFDEYIGGAVDKFPTPTLSDVGLMGTVTRPKMLARYYQQYLDYMQILNPEADHAFRLVYVPGPPAIVLLGVALAAVYTRARREEARRRRRPAGTRES